MENKMQAESIEQLQGIYDISKVKQEEMESTIQRLTAQIETMLKGHTDSLTLVQVKEAEMKLLENRLQDALSHIAALAQEDLAWKLKYDEGVINILGLEEIIKNITRETDEFKC